jgi:hypothetical protein
MVRLPARLQIVRTVFRVNMVVALVPRGPPDSLIAACMASGCDTRALPPNVYTFEHGYHEAFAHGDSMPLQQTDVHRCLDCFQGERGVMAERRDVCTQRSYASC